jgi:hypothetical protein
MKLGAENRKQVIALGVLGALALLFVVRAVFNSSAPEPTSVGPVAQIPALPAAPARKNRAPARTKTAVTRIAKAPNSIDPTLRFDWLKVSEDTQYAGNGRNIFLAQAEIPEPIKNGATDQQKLAEQQGPPQPPPPPPINLKFYGYASKAGEPKRIFLSQGEDVFIATEGQVIDRRYKVLRISPVSVEIEDMLYNNRQSIPLTQG